MKEHHGQIVVPKPLKPPIRWQTGEGVKQGDGECNAAAIVAALRCAPNNQTVDYQKAVHDWLDPVRTPNGSVFWDVLAQAKKQGGISGFDYSHDPSNALLKFWLKDGPVIVSHYWYDSLYKWQDGLLYLTSPKESVGHTWLCFGVNYNKKFFSMVSSWDPVANPVYKIPFEVMAVLLEDDGEIARVRP